MSSPKLVNPCPDFDTMMLEGSVSQLLDLNIYVVCEIFLVQRRHNLPFGSMDCHTKSIFTYNYNSHENVSTMGKSREVKILLKSSYDPPPVKLSGPLVMCFDIQCFTLSLFLPRKV